MKKYFYLLTFAFFVGLTICSAGEKIKLEFRLVKPSYTHEELQACLVDQKNIPAGYELMSCSQVDRPGKTTVHYYLVSKQVEMDGSRVKEARAYRNEFGDCRISLTFDRKGAEQFHAITKKYVGRQLAIVINGKLYCAPYINEPIAGGGAEISGSFTLQEAEKIAQGLAPKKSGGAADNSAKTVAFTTLGAILLTIFLIL